MDYEHFVHLVPSHERAALKESTLHLWHRMFYFILEHGEADVADFDEFISACQCEKSISGPSLGRHLARMSACGILQAHRMRRKADQATLILSRMMWFTAPTLPSTFIRYTLPGKEPSLRLRRGEKLWAEIRRGLREASKTEEFKNLGVDDLFSLAKE